MAPTRNDLSRASETLVRRPSTTSSSLDSAVTDTTSDSVRQVDRWTLQSGSTASFVQDLGMSSGRAICSFSKFQIRVLRRIWSVYRQRIIGARFPHVEGAALEGLDKMYDDLIDFSRCVSCRVVSWEPSQ